MDKISQIIDPMSAAIYFHKFPPYDSSETHNETCHNLVVGPDPKQGRSINCLILEVIPGQETYGKWKLYTPCGVWLFKGIDDFHFDDHKQQGFRRRREKILASFLVDKLNDQYLLITHYNYLHEFQRLPQVEWSTLDKVLVIGLSRADLLTGLVAELDNEFNLSIEFLFQTGYFNIEIYDVLSDSEGSKWFDVGKYVDKPIYRSIFIQYYEWIADY